MDISWLGHASFKIKGKGATVVTDPYDTKVMKFPKVEADIVSVSHSHFDHNATANVGGEPYVVSGPGEYEVKGVEIVGVGSFHDEKGGAERGNNTLYNFKIDKINVAHLGDLGQNSLSVEQIEDLGNVDILLIPVGGHYTIDSTTASKIVAQLEPKIIIPMHYRDPDNSIDVLEGVERFLKEMGKDKVEPIAKLTITPDKLPEETEIVLMTKS